MTISAIAAALLATTITIAPQSSAAQETTAKDSRTEYSPQVDNKDKEVEIGAVGDASRPATRSGPPDRYFRADLSTCNAVVDSEIRAEDNHVSDFNFYASLNGCPEGDIEVEILPAPCEDGSIELDPLWISRHLGDGQYADPEYVSGRECITPADVAAEAQRAFAALHIPTPDADIQGGTTLLVNRFHPVRTDAGALTQQVDLLGVPVIIRADPVEYTWDFDDPHTPGGDTLTTTDPGHHWTEGDPEPNASWVAHSYTHLGNPDEDPGTHRDDEGDWYRDDVTITLTTTWHGSYQLAGTSLWTPIDGQITTTTTLDPVTVTEARVRLVCRDIHGNSIC